MIDITSNTILPIVVLDNIVRSILGEDTSGVSIGDNSRIHLVNDTPTNRATAQAIFDNWGDLSVTADKTSMTEGDADPVVTCADSAISGDAEVGYVILLDGGLYADGTDSVVGGESELTIVDPVVGVYDIFIFRLSGYESGSVQITVNEA